jgi:hypothetical protein
MRRTSERLKKRYNMTHPLNPSEAVHAAFF